MRNTFVDFNCNYFTADYQYDESAIYAYNIQRLVVGNVVEVKYQNDYLVITYKTTKYKKGTNTIAIELKYIESIIVN